ncbi:MAG: hypothetical protein QM763_03550 [Agriterribacter sp.]
MKIRHLLLTLAAFIILGTVASCKKEDKKSKTELLTAASWKVKATVAVSGSTSIDLFSTQDECYKDNLYSFKTDNTIVIDEGAKKCDEEDDQSYSADWSFAENETKLIIDEQNLTLESLTASELKLSYTSTENDITYTYTITFGH